MTVRALHIVKTSVGGAWAWRQVRELVALGADIHVALPPGPMVDRYFAAGATVHAMEVDLPLAQPARIRGLLRDLRMLVRTVDPDLIHMHNVGPAMAIRAALGRNHSIPRLFQAPGPLHLEHALSRRLELASASSPDLWIASCQYTRRLYLKAGVPEDRVDLSYYGVDVGDFPYPQPAVASLHSELGIAEGTKIVGMVSARYGPKRYLGQLRGIKGHEDLIDAVSLGLSQGADVAVVFVGGVWSGGAGYERRLRSMAMRRCGGRAHFLGTRADVAQLYGGFDVAVHPSLSENMWGNGRVATRCRPDDCHARGGHPGGDPCAPDRVAGPASQPKSSLGSYRGRPLRSSAIDVHGTVRKGADASSV